MTEKPIILPVDRDLLKGELTEKRFLRKARKGNNEIYIVNHHNSPHLMREIGRLRELSFRSAGGGTGEEIDIDEFDTIEKCYEQLIVWSPEEEEIVGGYRFIHCSVALNDHQEPRLSTAHYFHFDDRFIQKYLPKTVELGRSWVQPKFQPNIDPRKGIYALDNLWDGLGAIASTYDNTEYYFGKVTMYPSYNTEARDFLLYFLHYYFPDKENLMKTKYPLTQSYDSEVFSALLEGLDFKHGYRVLKKFVRERGERVPPLINLYMQLSPTMKTFGTAVNPDFGGVEETGILITLNDIYQDKRERYIY